MKAPIQLDLFQLQSGTLPNRLQTAILKAQVLKIAQRHFKKGDLFLWSELRTLCENAGIYPDDERNGYQNAGAFLSNKKLQNGFKRIGEIQKKSLTKSRGGAKDVQWMRVK